MTTQDKPVTSYLEAPTRTVTANGVTFVYRELGPKGGIPVVFFVHLAATLDYWDPRIVEAIAKDRHVITFDQRGVGATAGEVPDSIEAMAEDAYAFIKALGFDQVDVFSFSLGGFVAQALIAAPDLVRRLVLTGTDPKGGKGIDKVAGLTYRDIVKGTLTRSDPREFLFFNRDKVGKPAAKAYVARTTGAHTEVQGAPMKVKGFQTQLKAIKKWGRGTPHDLSRLTQPTLIANGDHDRMVPSVLSEDIHRQIPGSELVIYPDSGHGGVFQYHEQFARPSPRNS